MLDEDMSEASIDFIIGELDGDYWKIKGELLDINIDLYIFHNVIIKENMFRAVKNISIFKKINKIIKEDIYITEKESLSSGQIPINIFNKLVDSFPNKYEVDRYVKSRIGNVLKDYFDTYNDADEKYEKYLNNKIKIPSHSEINKIRGIEKNKYIFILKELENMLCEQDRYSEKNWQDSMLDIITLIYPRYTSVFKEVSIKNTNNGNSRIDYVLLDETGNLDIIEIKKPNNKNIVSEKMHRNNYIPLQELSGTIMQIEKYIFYLNKLGEHREKKTPR